jgi:hypothetical protein
VVAVHVIDSGDAPATFINSRSGGKLSYLSGVTQAAMKHVRPAISDRSGCGPRSASPGTCFGLSLLALALWQTGCATTKSSRTSDINAPSITPPFLAALGTIGVTSTSTVPKFTLHQPLNRSEAGEFTARRIVFLGGDAFTDDTSRLVAHLSLGISPFVLSTVAVPSRTVAEAMAIPDQSHARANSALQEIISKLSLQDELRTRVVQQTTARAAVPITLVRKPFPPGREPEFARMSCVMAGTLAWLPRGQTAADYLAGQGIDTVLELQLIHPGLKGAGKINPPLALCVDMRARLLEARSGRELWHVTARHRSEKYKFTEWAANEGELFRSELDRCFASLSDQIVDQLLRLPAAPSIALSAGFPRPSP